MSATAATRAAEHERAPRSVRWSARVLMLLVYALVSTAAVDVFMSRGALFEGASREYSFEAMFEGTAHRPFAYRVMMPWLARASDAAVPAGLREGLAGQGAQLVERYSPRPPEGGWTPERLRAYLYVFAWMNAFALASLLVLRSLTAAVFPADPMLRDPGPVLFGAVLPLAFMNGGFMYDFAEYFFLALVMLLAWRRRYAALVPAIVLAILNKETAALSVAVVAAIAWHRDRTRRGAIGVAIVAAAGLLAVLALRHALSGVPGSTMYRHAMENLEFWSDWRSWVSVMTVHAAKIPFPRGLNLAMTVPLAIVLAFGARHAEPALRAAFVVATAIVVPLFFLFCWRDETRNLSLAFPAAYLVACAALKAGHVRGRTAG